MLDPLLPPGIEWAAGRIEESQGRLFAVEEKAVASAVSRRKAAFRAGRTCAREALRLLGCAELPIPVLDDRRPGWPDGIVGSITHTSSWAAAIAAHDDAFAGLGLDIEEDGPLEPQLHDILLRPDERARLPPAITIKSRPVDTAKAVFVIKEAVFKAVYPRIGVWFGFHDAAVSLDAHGGRFHAKLHLPALGSSSSVIKGTIGHDADHVVAAAFIPGKACPNGDGVLPFHSGSSS